MVELLLYCCRGAPGEVAYSTGKSRSMIVVLGIPHNLTDIEGSLYPQPAKNVAVATTLFRQHLGTWDMGSGIWAPDWRPSCAIGLKHYSSLRRRLRWCTRYRGNSSIRRTSRRRWCSIRPCETRLGGWRVTTPR